MPGIPPAHESDTEDVTWALQTAEALWKRSEHVDALIWLRRAAQAAGQAEHDDRALELAHDAAELTEWIAARPQGLPSPAATPLAPARPVTSAFREPRITQTDEVEEVSIEMADESAPSLPSDQMYTLDVPDDAVTPKPAPRAVPRRTLPLPMPLPCISHVPSAAEKHAGMLDPWAERVPRVKATTTDPAATSKTTLAPRQFDADEVVTSAPPIELRALARMSRAGSSAPPIVRSEPPLNAVDLSQVDALSDLPDDARAAFAAAAVVKVLARDEETSGFALAVVLEGRVDLAATIVDTPAHRFEAGGVIRARGTLDHIARVRLVAVSETARVATWGDHAVDDAFRTCPWVEDDLRAAGDRLQALVGVTMGPLGERLDPVLRAEVASKLTLCALGEHEVYMLRGKPIPGLLIVGAGELELIDDDGTPEGTVLRPGDFLFPSEVLVAGPAPSTVRAATGGALVLFADRHAAQELLMTYPPLLEIFAGM